ncbi:MAG TPA: hypothetical protein VHU77_11435, partial [Candidatus Limnocylindria bacterium]|nr:hypothetical protein [Candidatus Limnocylindria bacterium]
RAATSDATDDATRAVTRAATCAATDAATYDATDAATDDATRAATRAATCAATDAATYDATDAATDDATRAATSAATSDATRAATSAATDAATDLVAFLVRCCGWWYRLQNGGNQWSAWVSYLSFFRHVAKLDLPEYEKWQHYEAGAVHAGPRFMHRKFCVVSDRPTVVSRDDRNLPHGATGPAIAWRDGWALYFWHGQRVPARAILAPKSYTKAEYLAIRNTDVRRAIGEIAGWQWVADMLGASSIDKWTDPNTGLSYELLGCTDGTRLLRKQSPGLKDGGAQPVYLEPVHEELRTAQAARKWQATDWTPAACEKDPALTYGVEA